MLKISLLFHSLSNLVDSGLTRIELKSSRGEGYYPALILNKKNFFLLKFIYYLLILKFIFF